MNRLKGILMITMGSIFWGATGPMMEWMLHHTEMTAEFMLSVRLIIAGVIILSILSWKKQNVWSIWYEKSWSIQLIIFSVIGMLGLQYTFVKTIEVSDAVMATLLQFLAPIFIIIYVSFIHKKLPPVAQTVGMIGTLVGLFLLLTNGSFSTLEVSNITLIWGVSLGLVYAFYTLYPARLQAEWGVLVISGWGMIISGVIFAVMGEIWNTDEWSLLLDVKIAAMILALAVLGSAAFVLFLSSMKYISAVETSILSSFEPLTAMLISAIWLQAYLKEIQYVGAVVMLIFIVYLSIAGEGESKKS
jgi:drug/metabolite transporter (DMT)-like permease